MIWARSGCVLDFLSWDNREGKSILFDMSVWFMQIDGKPLPMPFYLKGP